MVFRAVAQARGRVHLTSSAVIGPFQNWSWHIVQSTTFHCLCHYKISKNQKTLARKNEKSPSAEGWSAVVWRDICVWYLVHDTAQFWICECIIKVSVIWVDTPKEDDDFKKEKITQKMTKRQYTRGVWHCAAVLCLTSASVCGQTNSAVSQFCGQESVV